MYVYPTALYDLIRNNRNVGNKPEKTDVKHSTKPLNNLTWIYVVSLEDKHNINVMSKYHNKYENIRYICLRTKTSKRLGEPRLYPSL